MTQNVRLQNLRDFTVQIRNEADQIVGTGIAVSMDGRIVTCRHVIETALRHKNIQGAEVGVYFPQLRGGEEKNRKAIVEKYFPSHDDDVVLLKLDGAFPLAPEQIPALGTADSSDGNLFRAYGYRKLDKYVAGWADGKIQGCVEAPEDFNVQCEPIQLESGQINSGMSGSAVLDTTRNLIVGIVSETWFPDLSTKDRDTAWAVNGRVLSLEPLGLSLQDMPLPLKAAPSPKFDVAQAEAAVFIKEKYSWNSAPTVLPEWTGRDDLLAQITADWNDLQKHVTGLIGFGGEGKSSLARKWIETLNVERSTFDGLFWWGLYENRSIDEFLEAALNFLSGGRIDPRQVPSSSLRAQIIGAMLGAGRYLFVLDGLEVLQHQDGDQYGLLTSNDLRDLLTYFARPDNQSFCLITSRAPVLDLMEYTTYTHRDVDRLSEADGILLLDKLGVKGLQEQKSKVVSDWNGHALTLSLVGSYLAQKYDGDVRFADKIRLGEKKWEKEAPEQYKHVSRILRRYDDHLSDAEKAFLLLFSAFRTAIPSTAFKKVFRKKIDVSALNAPLTKLRKPQFDALVKRLINYRIIRYDVQSDSYTAHPLIRNYYLATLTRQTRKRDNVTRANVKHAHEQIKDYYLSIAGDTPQYPTLDDLKPLIEVVHHTCEAGAHDEAFNGVYWERIQQSNHSVIIHQLGAYDTDLSLLLEFFPKRDTTQEPQVKTAGDKRWILNEIGLCLMSLGRLREAMPFYERYIKGNIEAQDWVNASIGYLNLAELHVQLGALEASAESARQALDLARKAEDKDNEIRSLVREAWAVYLQNNIQKAESLFSEAETLQRETDTTKKYLYGVNDIFHSKYLRRVLKVDYARKVMEASIEIASRMHIAFHLSQCYYILGDLDFGTGNHESARVHYETAIKIARSISDRQVLIEALLARGRFYAKTTVGAGLSRHNEARLDSGGPPVPDAFNDLNEALNYAVEGGYRIHEADIRVALGWAYLANGEKEKAKQSAQRALQMSQEMGYHWGKVDAEEMMNYE